MTWGATPVPAKLTVCGEPVALSATLTEAERAPTNAGVKVTETLQLAPAATLLPHVFVWLKSDALLPVTPMPVMDSAALPVFDTVIVWTALVVLTS